MPYYKYFDELAALAFGEPGVSGSSFLQETDPDFDSRPRYLGVTCGTELRRIRFGPNGLIITPTLTGSLSDLYKDISARFAVGMGIEGGRLRIERLEHYYQGDIAICDELIVKDFTEEPGLDYMGNEYINGYPIQNYDKLNGRFETNSQWKWKLPDGMKTGKIEEVCGFRSDPYGVEFTRAQGLRPTTDSEADNTIFVNELGQDQGGGIVLVSALAKNQTSISGVYDPVGLYNVSLSPKRNLFRRGAVLHAANWGQDSESVKFQTTDKNQYMTSTIYGDAVDEDADEPIVGLAKPLYLPIIQKFTTIAAINLPALIDANPFGYIPFRTSPGAPLRKGFLLQVEMKPGVESAFEWTLLAHPESYIG